MDNPGAGLVMAMFVGYLVIAAIFAIVMVVVIVSSAVAGVFISTFVISNLYSFNYRSLTMADYQRTAFYGFIVHGIALFLISVTSTSFGFNSILYDALWSAVWPIVLITTFGDGLFGLREYSYAVGATFFLTTLVVSYVVTYRQYVDGKFDDRFVRKKMFTSGLAMFIAVLAIPAYFIGNYIIEFVNHRPLTDAHIHEAYREAAMTPLARSVSVNEGYNIAGGRRLQSNGFRYYKDVPSDIEYIAMSTDGRWAFYAINSELLILLDFESGREKFVLWDSIAHGVSEKNLHIAFGPKGRAAIFHYPGSATNSEQIVFYNLDNFRSAAITPPKPIEGGVYDFSWYDPVWKARDIEAVVPVRNIPYREKSGFVLKFVRRDQPTIFWEPE